MLKIAYSPAYDHFLPPGHRFPMEKYSLLAHQLLYEGTCTEDNFFEPSLVDDKHIFAVHDPEYYYDLLNLTLSHKEALAIGFPMSRSLVNRERLILGATIQNCLDALEYGVGMNIAGGTHHAYADRGEGFCLLNDQAVAAQYLLDSNLAKKILIVDLDVHQGNGTAKIFENEDRVFTFSMHAASNYPFEKETSDWDIALADGTSDEEYLDILEKALPELFDKVKPDFVFYLSGVDILETDKLGKLSCSIEGCRQRDKMFLEFVKAKKIPLQISMGGGYSEQIRHIVEAHANTFRMLQSIYF